MGPAFDYGGYDPWITDNKEGNTFPDGDLILGPNGLCEFSFYKYLDIDPNDQMIMIRGTYLRNDDTIRIEWEPNAYLSSAKIQLVNRKDTADNDREILQGPGARFGRPMTE